MEEKLKLQVFISMNGVVGNIKGLLKNCFQQMRLFELTDNYKIQNDRRYSVITLELELRTVVSNFGQFYDVLRSDLQMSEILSDKSQISILGLGIGEFSPQFTLLANQPRIWLDKSMSVSNQLANLFESELGEPETIDSAALCWPFLRLWSNSLAGKLPGRVQILDSTDDADDLEKTSIPQVWLNTDMVHSESATVRHMLHSPSGSERMRRRRVYPNYDRFDTQIPLGSKTEPLPHDGLYLRRNNAFGTKLTGGIKEMLDQGTMIEQVNIRFDDFVASDTTQVPSPKPGNAIAISHGTAIVDSHYKYHQDTTHYLEIALKAADHAPEAHPKPQRLAMNYVFVVDISGSMDGEKLDFVKASIRELFQQLSDNDIVGIVAFSSNVKTVLKATRKGEIDPDEFATILSSLRTEGSTDINWGLQFGLDEIQRHQHADLINHLYLFSDGNPNSGEQSWVKIRQNVANRVRGNIGLSVFGFGTDVNGRELDALAGVTGGHYTFVIRPDSVKLTLQNDLIRREHLAAMNIQTKIKIDEDIAILHFYGHDQITDPASRDAVLRDVQATKKAAEEQFDVKPQPNLIMEEDGIRIFAPDLAVGETYWIVFELRISSGKTDANIGTAMIQYVDTFLRENKQEEINLTFDGSIPSDVVLLHGLGLWTSEVTFYALDDLYQNDYDTATKRINEHVKTLEVAARQYSFPILNDDITSLRKFNSLAMNLGQPVSYSEDSRNYAMFALSAFGQVRCGLTRL